MSFDQSIEDHYRKEIEERKKIEKKKEFELLPDKLHKFEKSAWHLLQLLRPEINSKKYDSVLGDDASGRIHALLLGYTIKEIYGKEKNLKIAFVKGGSLLRGSTEYAADVKKHFAKLKKNQMLGNRTLIVTEEIQSGTSLEMIAMMLRSLGVEADIATFGVTDSWGEDTHITSEGIKFYIGSQGYGPFIPPEYLGVEEAMGYEGHAIKETSFSKLPEHDGEKWGPEEEKEKYKKFRVNEELSLKKLQQDRIRLIRELVKSLAHKLTKKYQNLNNL